MVLHAQGDFESPIAEKVIQPQIQPEGASLAMVRLNTEPV